MKAPRDKEQSRKLQGQGRCNTTGLLGPYRREGDCRFLLSPLPSRSLVNSVRVKAALGLNVEEPGRVGFHLVLNCAMGLSFLVFSLCLYRFDAHNR